MGFPFAIRKSDLQTYAEPVVKFKTIIKISQFMLWENLGTYYYPN